METFRPRLLTPREAARWLRFPAARLVRLARAGVVPCVLLPGGDVLFAEDDLAAWLRSLKRPQGQTAPGRDDNR